jgi:hypothetical protein
MVVPAFTVSVFGVKVKLSIDTAFDESAARANRTPMPRIVPATIPSTVEAIMGRNIFLLSLALKQRKQFGYAAGDVEI